MSLLNGKYALERPLGGGGMAEVFLARTVGAEGFSRPVAIKRILPHYSMNAQFAAMFVSEARLSSRMQHPNVVAILDFDRDQDGGLFLVMELVDGVDLDGLMGSGMLPVAAIAFIVTEVLRGLGYAHDLPAGGDGLRGLVHRDVSPHNVLLSWEGAAKVSDFGIAKSRAASDATATEFIKGKPAYMSPEQANGQPLDGRSDLFAVGVMLWELLCGRPLFAGTTTQETLARLMFAPIPSPRQLRPDLPIELERITMRLLARERDQRYPNADAAIADLLAWRDYPRDGRELVAALLVQRCGDRAPQRARSIRSSVAATLDTPVPMPSQIPLPSPGDAVLTQLARGRGMRWLWPIAAVVLVLGLGTAVAISAGGRRSDRTTTPPAAAQPERPMPPASAPPVVREAPPSAPVIVSPEPVGETREAPAPTTSEERKAPPRSKKPRKGSGSGAGMQEVKLGGD
ncbi:MAG: protein kinase [Kofleriaceae bacterium]